MILLQMTDDKVEEKDPVTDQYPFARTDDIGKKRKPE